MTGNDGAIDLTATGGSGVYTYDWDNDGTGDNDDTEDLSGLTAGTYTVIVLDDNDCSESLSQVIESYVGIVEEETFYAKLFPNPSIDIFTIQFDRVYDNVDIDILDIQGKLVHHVTKNNTNIIRINEILPAGTYQVKITVDSYSTSLLFIHN